MLFHKNRIDESEALIYKCTTSWANSLLKIAGVKVNVHGVENIPKDKTVLFVGNHQGNFDIPIYITQIPEVIGFISKIEVEKIPLVRTWMNFMHCIFMDRSNLRKSGEAIIRGVKSLKAGHSLVIFPEGTRNKSIDGVLPFHAGSFKLAEKSGCRIIPIVQNNTAAALEDHLPFFKKTHTVLEFGKPIDVASMDREQKKTLAKDVQDLIEKMYEENKALV